MESAAEVAEIESGDSNEVYFPAPRRRPVVESFVLDAESLEVGPMCSWRN